MIIGIVAVDYNWGIGKDNHLLMSFKSDMKFFREMTKGHTVIMGKNTFLSLPNQQPLKNRKNIVLTNEKINNQEIIQFQDFDELLKYVQSISKTEDVFIIGGAMMYKSMLPYYDLVLVTKYDSRNWLNRDLVPDTYFPNLELNKEFEILSEKAALSSLNKIRSSVGVEELKEADLFKGVSSQEITFPKENFKEIEDKIQFLVYKRK